ncbi:hypothetical protein ACH4SK_17145 [Streptomyces inhibens]|uniref:hypothetical protein n=1 Tax=Streptomyces inhibens TaxID=2293571 RepID=UPI0037B096C4
MVAVGHGRHVQEGVEVTWHVYQQVRSICTATSPAVGRKTAEKVLESLHTCPVEPAKGRAARFVIA